jgi:hypothetical protein
MHLVLIHPETALKSPLPAILLGAAIGIALVVLCGWGIAALLGRRLVFRISLALLVGLAGLIGAVIGDAKAAEKSPLDEKELAAARFVFGESLDYSKIRLARGARLMTWPRRKMSRTPHNTVYFSKRYSAHKDSLDYFAYEDILIHELTHVWQTQHRVPFREKLGTALRVVFNKTKPYNYGGNFALRKKFKGKSHFRDFNTEQQGNILRDYFCCCFHRSIRQRQDACTDHERYARQARYNNGYYIERDTFP